MLRQLLSSGVADSPIVTSSQVETVKTAEGNKPNMVFSGGTYMNMTAAAVPLPVYLIVPSAVVGFNQYQQSAGSLANTSVVSVVSSNARYVSALPNISHSESAPWDTLGERMRNTSKNFGMKADQTIDIKDSPAAELLPRQIEILKDESKQRQADCDYFAYRASEFDDGDERVNHHLAMRAKEIMEKSTYTLEMRIYEAIEQHRRKRRIKQARNIPILGIRSVDFLKYFKNEAVRKSI